MAKPDPSVPLTPMGDRQSDTENRRALNRETLRRVVMVLCLTEITSWGVLYYALPVLAPAISRTTGWALSAVTGAFSASLVTAAVVGLGVGRIIDRRGPRVVMTAGSLFALPGLALIAVAPTYPAFLFAWILTGVAISGLLYPPAFVALTHWGGRDRVRALTALTVVAGLASTVFAPLTAALEGWFGWRNTYLVLACLLALITIPAHWLGLRAPWTPHLSDDPRPGKTPTRIVWRTRPFLVLLAAMSAAAVCVYAVVINLVPLLMERGLSGYQAAIALGLGGVGQVCGRLGYARLTRHTSPRTRAAAVFGAVALTTALIGVLRGPVGLFLAASVVVGVARGVFTLLQATAVSDRWGTAGFGGLNGFMSLPVTLATAAAPWLGSALVELLGSYTRAFLTLGACAVLSAALVPWTGAQKPKPVTGSSTRGLG